MQFPPANIRKMEVYLNESGIFKHVFHMQYKME
jgi:hypothetical protein